MAIVEVHSKYNEIWPQKMPRTLKKSFRLVDGCWVVDGERSALVQRFDFGLETWTKLNKMF